MTRGGTRPGSGQRSKGIVRRAMANLDASHNALMLELEGEMRMSASDVLRWCIRTAFESRKGRGKER